MKPWPLGTESRRTGSTGPKGGTTAPHRAPLQWLSIKRKPTGPVVPAQRAVLPAHPETACQRLEEKTHRGGTSDKNTGTSGVAVVPGLLPVENRETPKHPVPEENKRKGLRKFPPEVESGSTAEVTGTSGVPVLPVQISGELKVPVPGKISGSGTGTGHRKCPAVVPVLVPVLPVTEEQ